MRKRILGYSVLLLLVSGCGERDYQAEIDQTNQIEERINASNTQLDEQNKENWYDLGGELVNCAQKLNWQRCKDAGVEFKEKRQDIADERQQNDVEFAENAQHRAEIQRDQATNQ
ncbi:MAG: hypothetical protein PHO27_12295 [Sulfuricurvum sp.]|nr:hypothetical protein [Sulfuricurvum sp.]